MRTARFSCRLGGCLPGGVYLGVSAQGVYTPSEQNDWQTGVKIIPCPKLRLRAVISQEAGSSKCWSFCFSEFICRIDFHTSNRCMTNKTRVYNGQSEVRFIRIKSRKAGSFLLCFFAVLTKDVGTIEITLKWQRFNEGVMRLQRDSVRPGYCYNIETTWNDTGCRKMS